MNTSKLIPYDLSPGPQKIRLAKRETINERWKITASPWVIPAYIEREKVRNAFTIVIVDQQAKGEVEHRIDVPADHTHVGLMRAYNAPSVYPGKGIAAFSRGVEFWEVMGPACCYGFGSNLLP